MHSPEFRAAILACGLFAGLSVTAARADILITEVDQSGSSTSTYKQDWFELTNTGSISQDITGWAMDDNSHTNTLAVPLRDVSSIAPGQSVVFIENGTDSTTDAALFTTFETAWFGATAPAGFTIGAYGGSGVGLSSSADQVNIYTNNTATGVRITGVGFGASTQGVTFDNAAGLGGTIDPVPLLTTLSSAGVNGAFTSPNSEIGSPGAVPEPASIGLLVLGGMALLARRRR